LNWANALAGDIAASPNASSVFVKLVAADALAAVAKGQLNRWEYLDAVEGARVVSHARRRRSARTSAGLASSERVTQEKI
jgi:hypothetical protein